MMLRKKDDPEEDREEIWGDMQACIGTVRNRLKSGLYTLKDLKECTEGGVLRNPDKTWNDKNRYTEEQVRAECV